MNAEPVNSIRIYALDTLFFRDGKPFTMGAETWADAQFPPSPSVMYGALRAQYFGEHPQQLSEANTATDPTRELRITFLSLLNEKNRPLFPLPLDCVKEKIPHTRTAFLLTHREKSPVSNCPTPAICTASPEQQVETEEHGFVTGGQLERYLSGVSETFQFITLHDYSVIEPKIGIARQRSTHTSEDGKLYQVEMRRLKAKKKFGKETREELALYVEFEGLKENIAKQGIFRLGGEGKMAHYQSFKAKLFDPPRLTGNRFKLYLATPAFFAQGWLPGWIHRETLEACQPPYSDLQIRLETAIIGKPVRIGGFDMKAGEPKVMRQAVPAGSVYYFSMDGDIQQITGLFHKQCCSDYESQQGFGLTFIGAVQ